MMLAFIRAMFGKQEKSTLEATILGKEYPFLIEAKELEKLSETKCAAILENQRKVDRDVAELLGLPLKCMQLEFLKNFSDLYEKMDKNDRAAKSKLCDTLCISFCFHEVSEKIDSLKILSMAYGFINGTENKKQVEKAFVIMARIGNVGALEKCFEEEFNIWGEAEVKVQAAHTAAAVGQLRCMKYLWNKLDSEIILNNADRMLFLAAHFGRLECVKYLIKRIISDKAIQEAKQAAYGNGHSEVSKCLLEAYPDNIGDEKKEKEGSNNEILFEKDASTPLILSKNDDANRGKASEKKEGEDNRNDENSNNAKKRKFSLF